MNVYLPRTTEFKAKIIIDAGFFRSIPELALTSVITILNREMLTKDEDTIMREISLWKMNKSELAQYITAVRISANFRKFIDRFGAFNMVIGYCIEKYVNEFLNSQIFTKLCGPPTILVLDTETTGLEGYPQDRVLEIGISEINKITGDIRPIYNELIHYPDMREFAADYESKYGKIWEYANTDMTIEDTLNAKKDLATVICEVRSIVKDRKITSYNVKFDFDKFLFQMPWNLQEISKVEFDIMDMATDTIRDMMEHDSIPDKALQGRLIDEDRAKPGKWIRSLDAYKVLCPDDPAKREGVQSHRALDDTIQEAHILKALWEIGRATE